MKKLLFLLLLIPTLSHAADTFSTGTIIVTLPSTNTHSNDWGQKINNGLQAIITKTDASFTTLFARTSLISIYDNTNTFLGNATTIRFNNNLTTSMIGSTLTVNGNAGGGSVGNSTFPYVLPIDGPLYLSTTTPAAFRFTNRSTFTVVGWQACVEKASSSSATMFELAWSSSTLGQSASGGGVASPGNYGLTYYPFTFKLEITTQARCSVYQSTVVPIWQETEWGVRVTTITDSRSTVFSGLPAEGARISVFGWENRGTTW